MSELLYAFILGLIAKPLLTEVLPAIWCATRFASKDCGRILRAGLKPHVPKYKWATILPRYFVRVWLDTFADYLRGCERTA